MSAHATAAPQHGSTTRLFIFVWCWLVAITGVEVYLAYLHLPANLMLTILVGLSVVKAALIIAYFMHLRFERLSLVLMLIPALILCISLMLIFMPDGFRLLHMRPTP